MGPIRCPEISVRNYHYSLRNSPEERTSQRTKKLRFHMDGSFGGRHKWTKRASEKEIPISPWRKENLWHACRSLLLSCGA
jgi:hypothetical protein